MSQHFQGPFGPLVLTFCGPSPNLRAIGQRACLISTPVPDIPPVNNDRGALWENCKRSIGISH